MKTYLPTTLPHYKNSASSELVFACAWCPQHTYQKLKRNQQYTHGICQKHKNEFIVQIKERTIRI
jgi:hypothetical protein